jgi:hypothetical protein
MDEKKHINITLYFLQSAMNSQEYLLKDYISEIERYFNKKTTLLKQKETDLINLGFVNKLEDFYDYHEADYYNYSEAFPNIMRVSVTILLYSNFEHYLIKLCEYEYVNKKFKERLDEFKNKDTGIIKAIKYLEEYSGLKLNKNSCWSEIMQFNKIRNKLVHSHGIIAEKQIKNATIYKNKIIELNDKYTDDKEEIYGELKINKGALEHFNKITHDMMKEIFIQLLYKCA